MSQLEVGLWVNYRLDYESIRGWTLHYTPFGIFYSLLSVCNGLINHINIMQNSIVLALY